MLATPFVYTTVQFVGQKVLRDVILDRGILLISFVFYLFIYVLVHTLVILGTSNA